MNHQVYALYKGDFIVGVGTYAELSQSYGLTKKHLMSLYSLTKRGKLKGKGFTLYKVEEVENNEQEGR